VVNGSLHYNGDPLPKGVIARKGLAQFMNICNEDEAAECNVRWQRDEVALRVKAIAKRDIAAGEELIVDYAMKRDPKKDRKKKKRAQPYNFHEEYKKSRRIRRATPTDLSPTLSPTPSPDPLAEEFLVYFELILLRAVLVGSLLLYIIVFFVTVPFLPHFNSALKGGLPILAGSFWDFVGSRQFDITKLSDVFQRKSNERRGREDRGRGNFIDLAQFVNGDLTRKRNR
jgi:hypothetical protein